MGGKNSAPPPPNYTPLVNATKEQAKVQNALAEKQFAWAQDKYNQDQSQIKPVIQAAIQRMQKNDINADRDRQRYENEYQPLEDQAIQDAQTFATPGREQYEMGRQEATVAQSFDAQRKNATANLEGFGIDPSSTRYAALDAGMRTQQAAAMAGAGNNARTQTESMGRALRSEAINVGRGLPGQVAQTYGTSLQSGNQGVNSTLAGTASGASTMGTAPGYYAGANSSLANAGNMMNMGYQNQLAQYNANENSSSGLGSLAGAALGTFMKFAEGGAVDDVTPGGNVPDHASPSQGKAIDDVPARLTAGEFVVPKDVLSWKGEEFFQNVIKKSRGAKDTAPAKPKFALAPDERATFTSRPNGALPVG